MVTPKIETRVKKIYCVAPSLDGLVRLACGTDGQLLLLAS